MGDVRLFHVIYGGAHELAEHSFPKERGLQGLFEEHLRALTDIDFLASEHSTGQRHKRRIDTLGIDTNGCPVVIEYKRSQDQNIINQGLDYLDWLEDHPAAFRELVHNKLGRERATGINFKSSWLLCVAGAFPRQDEVAARNSRRRIGLLRYRRYGEAYVSLEWVFGRVAVPQSDEDSEAARKARQREAGINAGETRRRNQATQQSSKEPDYSKFQNWSAVVANAVVHGLFKSLCDFMSSLGNDVQINPTTQYISFKTTHNVAYVFPQTGLNRLKVYVYADLERTPLREEFIRKLSEDNAYPPCNAQIFIYNQRNLEEANKHLLYSYHEAG